MHAEKKCHMSHGYTLRLIHLRFWLLPLALFVATMLPLLLMHGMPNADGYTYASIARNLAEGHGSFWQPYFSKFHQSVFYDHPALGFSWLEWLYKLFGDHTYIEKAVSFIVTLMNWVLGYMIAKRFIPTLRWYNAWLLLVCWLLVLPNPWFYSSFMQEPIMNIFSYTALYAIIVSYQQNSRGWQLFAWMTLAGVSTCVGVYINGFLVLYVWLVESCLFLVYRQRSARFHAWRCLLLVVVSIVMFAACMPAHANFIMYFKYQVLQSLNGNRVQSIHFGWGRFHIVFVALASLWLVFIAAGIASLFVRLSPSTKQYRDSAFFILLFIVSLFPIMLSSKQMAHYALQCYFFMIIALTLIFMPPLYEWLEQRCVERVIKRKITSVLSTLLFLAIIWVFVFLNKQRIFTDSVYSESQSIIKHVGEGAVVSAPFVAFNNVVYIEAYLQRFGKINLKTDKKPTTKYLINAFPSLWELKSTHYRLMPFSAHYKFARLYKKYK